MDETMIKASLPYLDVEMTRKEPAPGKPEVITIRLTATPSMEAFGEHAAKALPFLGPFGTLSMMSPMMQPDTNPMLAWAKMVEAAWAPYLPQAMLSAPTDKDDTGR